MDVRSSVEVKSVFPIVKVRWNSKRGPEFTGEREDQMQKKYPNLFTNSCTPAIAKVIENPESDPSEDPSSDHVPPLPAISPFLSSDDDTTNSDTLDTPPHSSLWYDLSLEPIPHVRSYRYHLNGPVHMMTVRKRVRPLPTHRLAVRHFADHSSSDSSLEASSYFHSDASSDPSLRHSLSDHSSPDLPSTSAGPSRKRHRGSVSKRYKGYIGGFDWDIMH
ncbi:hypothetical protein Tco_0005449 [Tanacetum coccineum]